MLPQDNYKIRLQSLEYLPVKIVATQAGALYDPTGDDVEMALPVIDVDPEAGDWKVASWTTVDDEYFARLLVGPDGDIELERGDYDILVRVTDSPEIPVMRAGRLTIV